MKIYIAGKITNCINYKERFKKANDLLNSKGNRCMNPSYMESGFSQEEYLKVCFAMIDICEGVYFLNNWKDSPGAKWEFEYAKRKNKIILFEGDSVDN